MSFKFINYFINKEKQKWKDYYECVDDEGVTKATVVKTERAKHEGNYLVAKEVLKVETTFDN